MDESYVKYAVDKTMEILQIDSPTGYTKEAADWTVKAFRELGCKAEMTVKGGVMVDFGGEDSGNALMLQSHIDTLGGIVCEIKSNGRLTISNLGGLRPVNIETENCRVRTRDGRIYEGTMQLIDASTHVNLKYSDTPREFSTMEIVLDEPVFTKEDTLKLGIRNGDFVCFEPRTRLTASGYLKSRFLDDKLSIGMLLGLAAYMRDNGLIPRRRLYAHLTVYEEVGHGAAATMPAGVTEIISVDMGCVGIGLDTNEHKVSICAKDAGGPYSYEVVSGLIAAAEKAGADYAVDVFRNYVSDADVTVKAGWDVKHGCMGAGVYASHSYERVHLDGIRNTMLTLKEYLEI